MTWTPIPLTRVGANRHIDILSIMVGYVSDETESYMPLTLSMAAYLALREYQETATYCHFGRKPYTKDGLKFFEWENAKDLSKYKSMSSEQVAAELKASNYLTKWVD